MEEPTTRNHTYFSGDSSLLYGTPVPCTWMAAAGPDGNFVVKEEPDEEKAWDKFLRSPPVPAAEEARPDGWTLLHDGRSLEAALIAAAAELVSDLIWGNLALPINKTLEKLRIVEHIRLIRDADRTDEQCQLEANARRECREMLELSTNQLEEMMEKKGEFGREYRIVTAAWYMMMMPSTHLGSPLMAPDDASKAAWEFNEAEYERRRVEGQKWRTAREDEVIFDLEKAKLHPYQFGQTRRRYEFTVTIPVPAKTRAADVRVKTSKTHLRVMVITHPLQPVIDDELFDEVRPSEVGGEWHLEGEFETRRLVLDLEKDRLGDWPCLLRCDAPAEEPKVRRVVSGARGEVDVYADDESVLERPTKDDRFFSWGSAPTRSEGGARSIRQRDSNNHASPAVPRTASCSA